MAKHNTSISSREQSQPENRAGKPHWFFYLSIILGIGAVAALILMPFLTATAGSVFASKPGSCQDRFSLEPFNADGVGDNLDGFSNIYFGEVHGDNERTVAACIKELAGSGDHLLIEAPGSGKKIPCGSVHPIYAQFNNIQCYGFDASIDRARRLAGSLSFGANFLAKHSDSLLMRAQSGAQFCQQLMSFATMVEESAEHASANPLGQKVDPDILHDQAAYLRNLVTRLKGLSLYEIGNVLIGENKRLVTRANHYLKISRGGTTNRALTNVVAAHRRQLQGSSHRLFVVAGASHLDLSKNKPLQELIAEGSEPTAILRSK